ncbi:hypothetical protein F4804DRAFT_299651 [Jackrogersella minutella]|nr:hypothetical protein F4804DRAFT_299651 [Jackrogersella minutella]
MPAEVILMIYECMDDIGDVKATMSTCKQAKAFYDANSGVIAKAHILRTLSPINIRLGIMAIASRAVEPTDAQSVEQFFHRYIWHTGSMRLSDFTMDLAAALPSFSGLPHIFKYNCDYHPMVTTHFGPSTRTEEDREIRTCLMVETAANLFYRGPGKDGRILPRAPYAEWEKAYWACFSIGEVACVLEMNEHYCHVFKRGMRLEYSFRILIGCDCCQKH